MLHPDAYKQMNTWHERKRTQWERVKDRMAGLQLVRYGEHGTTYMLVRSTPEFYESLIFGRLPTVDIRPGRGPMPPRMTIKKPLIDLSDDELDLILERWEKNLTAVTLPFVGVVWGRDGNPRTDSAVH